MRPWRFAYTFRRCLKPTGSPQTDSELPKVPHWPAIIAILADASLYLALPPALSVGPPWLLLAVVVFLLIPIVIAHWRGNMALTRALTLVANGVITAAMICVAGISD